MKAQIHLAQRDISDAAMWLRENHVDLAELSLTNASARLTRVATTLMAYGPDARVAG
jgi:hypothetical protein